MDANDFNDASEETVEKGQGHDQQASPSLLWLVKLGQAVSGPFRFISMTAVNAFVDASRVVPVESVA